MRKIGVVTVGRSDFGIYLPVLEALRSTDDLQLSLLVSGAHLSGQFGDTIQEIRDHGFAIDACVDMLLASDRPGSIGMSMGMGLIGFTQSYCQIQPDLVLVLGDRFEMHAAATAAVPLQIPLAHLHGGEVTEGAIDESFRHSITKMSHLHFVATQEYRRRVIQLGEQPWRVVVSGAPALDRVGRTPLLDRQQFEQRFGIPVDDRTLLVTYHPVTCEPGDTTRQMANLLQAIEQVGCQVVFTYPNADAGNQLIIDMLRQFQQRYRRAWLVTNLGPQGYFSLMHLAAAMVGNSSSGIIEAASFALPVVNIGNRQRGRQRSANVCDVGYGTGEIIAAIRQALTPDRRDQLRGMKNPYGDGHAAERIVYALRNTPLDQRLLMKCFYDLDAGPDQVAELDHDFEPLVAVGASP